MTDQQEHQRHVDRAARVQWRLVQGVMGRQAVPGSPTGYEPDLEVVDESAGMPTAISTTPWPGRSRTCP